MAGEGDLEESSSFGDTFISGVRLGRGAEREIEGLEGQEVNQRNTSTEGPRESGKDGKGGREAAVRSALCQER